MSVYFEKLENRDLWIDGSTSLSEDNICNRLMAGEDIREILENNLISERSKKSVNRFLKLVPDLKGITPKYKTKSSVESFDTSFNIDRKYTDSSIEKFLVKKLKSEIVEKNLDENESLVRVARIEEELALYEKLGLSEAKDRDWETSL